jgi:hypothetical protein
VEKYRNPRATEGESMFNSEVYNLTFAICAEKRKENIKNGFLVNLFR